VKDVVVMRKTQAPWRAIIAIAIMTGIAGCSTYRAPAPAVPPPAAIAPARGTIIGVASWYGPGFNGHRTSSGEIYNQEDLTAASTLYPLGSRVMVTNLSNDRAVEVRINDHGPYVKGRKIDLSKKAARMVGMIGPGTAPVRIDLLSAPASGRSAANLLRTGRLVLESRQRVASARAAGRVLSRRQRRSGRCGRAEVLSRADGRVRIARQCAEPRRPDHALRPAGGDRQRMSLLGYSHQPLPSRLRAALA
jgi:rare lipoprotein A (peptidoglycan hydrolase)